MDNCQAKGIARGNVTRLTLAPQAVSYDTIECLETLLAQARMGNVIGLAYAAELRQRNYIVDTSGECHRNPTFALGMVQVLGDKLSKKIRAGVPD